MKTLEELMKEKDEEYQKLLQEQAVDSLQEVVVDDRILKPKK